MVPIKRVTCSHRSIYLLLSVSCNTSWRSIVMHTTKNLKFLLLLKRRIIQKWHRLLIHIIVSIDSKWTQFYPIDMDDLEEKKKYLDKYFVKAVSMIGWIEKWNFLCLQWYVKGLCYITAARNSCSLIRLNWCVCIYVREKERRDIIVKLLMLTDWDSQTLLCVCMPSFI